MIDLSNMFSEEVLGVKSIQILKIYDKNKEFLICDKDKQRIDSIQIRIGSNVSFIWDLEENEEVSHLIGWSHLNKINNLIRSGY